MVWEGVAELFLDTFNGFSSNERFRKNLKVSSSFELIPDEQIIFPMETCTIMMAGPVGFSIFTRDVIVTNRRILLGVLMSVMGPLWRRETFMSLWHPQIRELCEKRSIQVPSGTKIERVELGKDKMGKKFVKFRIPAIIFLKTNVRIYHPKAGEIPGIFSFSR